MPKQTYNVEIYVSHKLIGNMDVTAESEEEAEDLASDLIILTAKSNVPQPQTTN